MTITQEQFNALVDKWEEDTKLTSSMSEILNHPSYREIVSHGTFVIPFILKYLREGESLLFVALPEITGYDPIAPEFAGNIKAQRWIWLNWGYLNKLMPPPDTWKLKGNIYV
jgi:hypothetical protein